MFHEIRDRSKQEKLDFISNVLSQTELPLDFIPIAKSNANKIFFRNNGERRDWVFFEKNTFFCAYCMCFSLVSNRRLVMGVNYEKNCRIVDILNQHETEKLHTYSKTVYNDTVNTCDSHQSVAHPEKRIVLRTIMKIIIFQATHG